MSEQVVGEGGHCARDKHGLSALDPSPLSPTQPIQWKSNIMVSHRDFLGNHYLQLMVSKG